MQAAIQQASGNLPPDLPAQPTLSKQNPNEQPILYISLTSDSLTFGQIYDFANTLVAQRISIMPGVSKVDLLGSKGAIRIKADQRQALRAPAHDGGFIENDSKRHRSISGAGQFDGQPETFLLQPQDQLETAADATRIW